MAGGARALMRCILACWGRRFTPSDDPFSARHQRSMWPSSWLVIGTVRWICARPTSDRSTQPGQVDLHCTETTFHRQDSHPINHSLRHPRSQMVPKSLQKALLLACLVVSIREAAAGTLCTATTFAGAVGSVTTCDCPAGTGPTGQAIAASPSVSLPTGTYGANSATPSVQLAAANAALALCVDLLPGYKLTATTALPTACVIGDGYCPGKAAAFTANAIITTGADGSYSAPVLTAAATITGGNPVSSPVAIACPTNTANTGQSAPFTLAKCLVNNGYYVATVASSTANTPVVSQCTAGSVCLTGLNAASTVLASAPISCNTQTAFICPLGTYGTIAGATVVATDAGTITGEVLCDATTRQADSTAQNCVAKAGYYGASVTTTAVATACPTGSSSAAGSTAVTACTQLAAGYSIANSAASGSAPTACPAGFYCAGSATPTPSIASGVWYNCLSYWDHVCKCVIICTALAAGYYIPTPSGAAPALSTSTAVVTNGVALCTAGNYCSTAAGKVTYTSSGSTYTWAFTATAATACGVTGATSAAGATAASGCNLVGAGYYIDPSGLNTPVACSVGEYCPGNGGLYLNAAGTATATASVVVGTAGGDYNCPAGSVAPGTAPSTSNSALNDCNLLPNFYIPTGTGVALYVPVSCPAGSHCPGGGAIGTAGGSFVCPANSTIPACTVAAVTAPSVTVAAAAAPAVTVAAAAAPAVTVAAGAAPVVNVTVAAAPIVSAAPRAAAHAAVLALTAMAALVAF